MSNADVQQREEPPQPKCIWCDVHADAAHAAAHTIASHILYMRLSTNTLEAIANVIRGVARRPPEAT